MCTQKPDGTMRFPTTQIDLLLLPFICLVLINITSYSHTNRIVVAAEEELYSTGRSSSSTGSVHSHPHSRLDRHMMHHPPIVGGYAPITDLPANGRVREIALYVLEKLMTSDAATHSASRNNDNHKNSNRIYSFQSELVHENDTNTAYPHATVVAGNQQVVAGMNYHLTMIITTRTATTTSNDDEDNYSNNHREPTVRVVGGFEVVVYDQFGTLSITRWGTELSMHDAQELWTHYDTNHPVNDDTIETTNGDAHDVNEILDSEGT